MKEKLKYVSNNMKSYRARLGYSQEDMAEFLELLEQLIAIMK